MVRSVLVPCTFVGLLFYNYGLDTAMNEVANIVLYVAAFVGIAVIPTFLWHLWLAPYGILKESVDNAIKIGALPSPYPVPTKIAVADFKEFRNLLLYEAACLWVEVRLHHPVTDLMAEIKMGQLKSAIRNGELRCQWRSGLITAMEFIATGALNGNPSDTQNVSVIELRRYADRIGNVPKFLQHVQVPLPSITNESGEQSDKPS